ncbi:MAG: uracil-DNA glycosylase [Desulfobacterales bacterium]|jgi:DNA polymerase
MTKRNALAQALEEISSRLQLLSANGCRGFDCSEQTLQILATWDQPRINSPETLENIRADIGDCQRCRLAQGRTHIVFGSGDPGAKLVFVGEGPGFEEDRQGEPFVGPAGQLLSRIIAAIKLNRAQVYICNVVKCRPPGNRNPEHAEIESCFSFLERQIAAIDPDFICALGTCAAQTLLKTDRPISKLRGRFHDYLGIKLLPTYHPAYLLRNPDRKRDVWEDMKMLMKEYRYEE